MYSCSASEIFCKNKCIGETCLGEGGKMTELSLLYLAQNDNLMIAFNIIKHALSFIILKIMLIY